MSENKRRGIVKILLLVFVLILSIVFLNSVKATDPSFDPSPPSMFNLTQDVNFYYDLNATDPDNNTPFVFSDDAASRGWYVFLMNNVTGEINFTPSNDDVGSNQVTLIVTDSNLEQDSKLVNFNVSNVNDPPNITGYTPTNLTPTIYENDSIGFTFNYNATDPDLPYGDSLTNTWYMDGVNQSNNQSWTYTPDFCEPSNRNITLIVWDLYNATDSVEWNVTVINVNRPVEFNSSSPIQDITWPEDTDLINNISLNNYFYDLDYSECNDSLNFSVVGNQSIVVNISSITPHNVSFHTLPDWFGVEVINFTAWDGYDNATSNNVVLNVTDVEDAPVIENISDQVAYAYAPFSLQVNASDPDNDTLTYYDNTTMFDINPSTGLISFTPNQSNVGNYSIMINVTDDANNVFTTFDLTIYNNSVPGIDLITDQVVEESSLFQITVNGSDSDADNLTFQTNYSAMINPVWSNATSATFSFTPYQYNVGNHSIKVTVLDEHGASNFTIFNLSVTDINNPPVLDSIPTPQIVKINKSFTMQLNASDADGDELNFTHNASPVDFPNFYMNSSGFINFTANASDEGNHSLNITVWDVTAVPKQDSQIVLYIVTYNRPPIIDAVGMQNGTEDDLFTLQINATDPDNDPIVFYTNSTIFNISTGGLINFTPNGSHVGLHNISVNVSDGDGGWGNITFLLNISDKNDAPYFDPPLENLSIWNNIYEDSLIEIYVNATDEENDDLTFTRTFLNGSTIFNITKIGTNQALINFTPTQADVGYNYSVNITVSDGINTTWVVINFSVYNVNDAPNITRVYPYGTPLSNYTVFGWANHSYFPNGSWINASENMSIFFNHSSTDPDNASLIYIWYFNGNIVNNQSYWNYSLNFSSNGTHNVTLVVSDGNLSDSMYWNLSVSNVNRPPVFGKKIHDDYADFSGGSFYRTNVTSDGRIELSENSSYYPNGLYNSSVINLDMDDGFNYSTISWSAYVPNGTSADIKTRTSTDGLSWSSWSSAINITGNGNVEFPSLSYRYVQYMINLSTSNTSITPYISSITINYVVSNKSLAENQDVNYGAWIDLDDFFYDPDGDSLNFSVGGESNIDVIIQNTTNFVGLFPVSVGTDTITFSAIDSNGDNITSNSFLIIVTEATGTGLQETSSSGGTSVVIRTKVKEEEKEVEKIINLDIIVPEALTTYRNSTIVSPIRLRNTGKEVLENINLSASSNNTGLTMEFTKSFFKSLGVNEEEKTNLVITSPEFLGNYEIVVTASVQNPEFEDSAKIILNTLEKGELNKTQLYTKITFTEDLLLANPECLELMELLKEAEKAVNESRFVDANDQIEKAIRGCRYLIAAKETFLEEPSPIERIYDRIFGLTSKNRVLSYVLIIAGIFTLLTFSLLWERFRKGRELKKKKS